MPISSIRRIAVAASVAALVAVPSAVATAPAAGAQPYPPTTGQLFLSSTQPFAGGPLFFLVTGFVSNEQVAARLDRTLLRIVRASRTGVAQGTVRIPSSTRALSGTHVFSLRGLRSGRYLSQGISVRRLPGRRDAASPASVKLDTAPVSKQVAPSQKRDRAWAAVGAASVLGALGGGAYWVLRRRRTNSW